MNKRYLVVFFAASMVVAMTSGAQQAWDGQFDFDELNDHFLATPLIDQAFMPGLDAETLPGFSAEAGIDDYAEMKLLEYVLSTPTAPAHATIYGAFETTYPIADSYVAMTQLGLIFRKEATKIFTAFLIRNLNLGLAIASDFGINNVPQADRDKMVQVGHLLSASGDLDGNGGSNLLAWQNAAVAPDYPSRVTQFIANATTQPWITVQPLRWTMTQGETVQFEAESTSDSAILVWESMQPAIASVDATGLVSGLAPGIAEIVVRDSYSGTNRTVEVLILEAPWHEMTDELQDFGTQGAAMAANAVYIDLPSSNFANVDLNDDGVLDDWQLRHLSFVLWREAQFPADKNLVSGVQAEFDANVAAIAGWEDRLNAIRAYILRLVPDTGAVGVALESSASNSSCGSGLTPPEQIAWALSGYSQLHTAAGLGAAIRHLSYATLNQQQTELRQRTLEIGAHREVLAGLAGLDQTSATVIGILLQRNYVEMVLSQIEALLWLMAQVPACFAGEAIAVEADDVLAVAGPLPTLAEVQFQIYGATARPGEAPFSGSNDYNGDGRTNAETAAAVHAAQGTRDDYVEQASGEVGGAAPEAKDWHSADLNRDHKIGLSELLRLVQFFNMGGYHCDDTGASEDGFQPGHNTDKQDCTPHDTDYNPRDWDMRLSEILRMVQFFNAEGYVACPGQGTEDGFCLTFSSQ